MADNMEQILRIRQRIDSSVNERLVTDFESLYSDILTRWYQSYVPETISYYDFVVFVFQASIPSKVPF